MFMTVLGRLLRENFNRWDELIAHYEQTNRTLKVPPVEKISLHLFNVQVEEEYTKALYDFGRARRNKDAIDRLLDMTLKDYYKGSNELSRKAGGIQYAKIYPTPEDYPQPTVNLFDLEDRFAGYYYSLDATVKSLQAKASAKITNNSLLNIEQNIIVN
jgi:hypothetical protein